MLKKEIDSLQQENNCINKLFTATQRTKMQRGSKRIKWTVDDIAKSISIYSCGPKSYRFLVKKGYPFPAVSTLRGWACKIDIRPGYLKVVSDLMKNTNLSKRDRVSILMADEMRIRGCYEYDKKTDTLHAPYNYVQVIMARGVFSNWKQPIYYAYDTKLTKNIIDDAIRNLESIGYEVVSVVMDMGGGNRGLWKEYRIDENKPYLEHPNDSNRKVFMFADAPHLAKLLRNHFIDDGILSNGKKLTAAPLFELLQKDKEDLRIAPRLISKLLIVKGSERQKVRLTIGY